MVLSHSAQSKLFTCLWAGELDGDRSNIDAYAAVDLLGIPGIDNDWTGSVLAG